MAEEDKLVSKRSFSNLLLKSFNEEKGENGIELGLGLSMNGRFGVDPRAKKLCRSSSVSDFTNPIKENGFIPHVASSNGSVNNVNLVRSCSLPVETEEEWRRRKELQTLRRMEAKRKRTEKKNLRGVKVGSLQNSQNCYNQEQRGEQLVNHVKGFSGCGGGGGGGDVDGQGRCSTPPALVTAQGSQGSGSSGVASDESQHGAQGKFFVL